MITVTMTSLPDRLRIAQYALQSMELQTLAPDRVVINLDKNQFASEAEVRDKISLPLNWEMIEINLTNDIGPHTKLLPVLRSAKDDEAVITIDDDVIYSPVFLERLIRCSEMDHDCIICGRAREIKRNAFGGHQVYNRWPNASTYKKSVDLLPLGVGGVLYRRSFFTEENLFNDALVSSAPHADDLTFKMLGKLNDVNVVVNPEIFKGSLEIRHSFGLMSNNWQAGKFTNFLSNGVVGRKVLSVLQYA